MKKEMFKVGDSVRLISTKHLSKETRNWIKEEKTKPEIGDEFVVEFVEKDGWIKLDGLYYRHPPEKFELASVRYGSKIFPFYRDNKEYKMAILTRDDLIKSKKNEKINNIRFSSFKESSITICGACISSLVIFIDNDNYNSVVLKNRWR